jgi:hypothetical protein
MSGVKTNAPRRGGRRVARRVAKSAGGAAVQEYFSIRHPDYEKAEFRFWFNWSSIPRLIDSDQLDQLEDRLQDAGEAERAVFDAIKLLGLSALHPPVAEASDPDDAAAAWVQHVEEISRLIWEYVGRWYEDARRANTPAARAAAAQQLRRLGGALAGSRQGKRANTVTDRFAVYLDYHRTLFRLEQALRLLKVWPWSGSRNERITAVCGAYAFPENEFRLHLRLDKDGRPGGKATPRAEIARTLTGKKFRISESRVASILSERPPSRK